MGDQALTSNRKHWLRYRIPVAIAIVGVLICGISTWLQWSIIQSQRELVLKEAIDNQWNAFRTEITRAEDLQQAVAAFLEVSEGASWEQFEGFAAKLPSVNFQAVSFAPHVSGAKRRAYETMLRESRIPGFGGIWESGEDRQPRVAADRSSYFPVTYLYPLTFNQRALGYDLLSEPHRQRAILLAIETGRTVRTEPIRLVQDPTRWAFLAFKAVYGPPSKNTGSDTSHPELLGIVSGVYQYESLLESAITHNGVTGHDIALFDPRRPSSPVYVHYSRGVSDDKPNLDRPMTVLAESRGARMAAANAMNDGLLALFIPFRGELTSWWRQLNVTICITLAIGLLLTAALVWNETRAQRLKIEAEKANEGKTRFLAAASHDLRQPMYALQLFAEGLHHEIGEHERAGPLIQRLNDSIDALSALLDSLLDISALETGGLSKNVEHVPVQALLRQIERLHTPVAIARGLRFSVVSSKAWIRTDPDLLLRVLENLVANALKYTESGGVVVGCRRRANALSIEVWDTGVGIPIAQQDQIFGEFFRLDHAGQRHTKGLGLGLAIVDRIARLLGHPIRVRSVPGRGSMFAADVPYGEEHQNVDRPTEVEDFMNTLRDARVIVIDDDKDIVDATRQVLERWGCIVTGFSSGADALHALGKETSKPQLLICDHELGHGEDGLSSIRSIRHLYSQSIPAILVSGNQARDLVLAAHRDGVEMLVKPIAPARLRQVMQRLLANRLSATDRKAGSEQQSA
jgi:signal transduction histidine kinase/ActR/RegA family two-component response regulator